MKKITSLFLICLSLILFCISCKKVIDSDYQYEQTVKGDYIMHKFMINGNQSYVLEKNGTYYYADDMILSEQQFNYLKMLSNSATTAKARSTIAQDFAKTWPNGVVYYEEPPAVMAVMVHRAMDTLSSKTGIEFVLRNDQTEYLQFRESVENSSPVGFRPGSVNTIKLNNHDIIGTVMHEIMHSLGVKHEHTRPDRNLYVIVDTALVADDKVHNFNIDFEFSGHGPFDFGSVMLYRSTDFAKNVNNPPLRKLDGSTFGRQRDSLSNGDINGLLALYKPVTPEGVYQILPKVNLSKAVDVQDGKTSNGTKIVILDITNHDKQKFLFRKTNHGYFIIQSKLDTTKVLSLVGSSGNVYTKLELRTNAESDDQKWKLYNMGNDEFSFSPKNSPERRMNLTDGSTANGNQLQIRKIEFNNNNHIFKLSKVN